MSTLNDTLDPETMLRRSGATRGSGARLLGGGSRPSKPTRLRRDRQPEQAPLCVRAHRLFAARRGTALARLRRGAPALIILQPESATVPECWDVSWAWPR